MELNEAVICPECGRNPNYDTGMLKTGEEYFMFSCFNSRCELEPEIESKKSYPDLVDKWQHMMHEYEEDKYGPVPDNIITPEGL